MTIGIVAKTFSRPTLGETLDAVTSHGINCIQFNFSCVGLPILPERIEPALLDHIQAEFQKRRIRLAAVSGIFNLIHPDPAQRQEGLRRFPTLVAACRRLGVPVITLCTGTRDPDDMWRAHPDNATPEAWRDLLAGLGQLLPLAEAQGLTLAFEPETANVVDSTQKGRQLLDELHSPRLGVVMDPANLFHPGELPHMREILDSAFHLLGGDTVLAHAKDIRPGGHGFVPAGKGVLDYDHYVELLHTTEPDVPLVLHSLEEREVPECVAFLRAKLKRHPASESDLIRVC